MCRSGAERGAPSAGTLLQARPALDARQEAPTAAGIRVAPLSKPDALQTPSVFLLLTLSWGEQQCCYFCNTGEV